MKFLILVVVCALTQVMPVKAQELNTLPVVSGGDAVVEEVAKVTIPDVTGMTEADALAAMEAVVLPDGSKVEIIKTYEYSSEMAVDIVCAQTPAGEVTAEEAAQVSITVSLGAEPAESLTDATQQTGGSNNSFGIAGEIASEAGFEIEGNIESEILPENVSWDSLPYSYEYSWDNSSNCWYWGEWYDADGDGEVECYKTPEGTYDNNVRHKMQLYCDGEFVYLHIKVATIYGAKFNGEAYTFNIDGQTAAFGVRTMGGDVITGNVDGMPTGTQQVEVISGSGATAVPGSLAYFTKYENNHNSELELKIPLSEMKQQNESIDVENINVITFSTSNLTTGAGVTVAGASTFPLATAGAALLLIPGSTVLLKKKFGKKNEKESNE